MSTLQRCLRQYFLQLTRCVLARTGSRSSGGKSIKPPPRVDRSQAHEAGDESTHPQQRAVRPIDRSYTAHRRHRRKTSSARYDSPGLNADLVVNIVGVAGDSPAPLRHAKHAIASSFAPAVWPFSDVAASVLKRLMPECIQPAARTPHARHVELSGPRIVELSDCTAAPPQPRHLSETLIRPSRHLPQSARKGATTMRGKDICGRARIALHHRIRFIHVGERTVAAA